MHIIRSLYDRSIVVLLLPQKPPRTAAMDPTRHAQNRNAFEALLRQLPGFKGYLEQEYRRESDYLARKWLADQLPLAKQGVDQAMRRLVEKVQLDALPSYEALRGRLDGFMNQIRGADRGYSGLFDYVRIGEAELDQVYAVDVALTSDMQTLVDACRDLSNDAAVQAVDNVRRLLDELEAKFRQRGEILKGLGK